MKLRVSFRLVALCSVSVVSWLKPTGFRTSVSFWLLEINKRCKGLAWIFGLESSVVVRLLVWDASRIIQNL